MHFFGLETASHQTLLTNIDQRYHKTEVSESLLARSTWRPKFRFSLQSLKIILLMWRALLWLKICTLTQARRRQMALRADSGIAQEPRALFPVSEHTLLTKIGPKGKLIANGTRLSRLIGPIKWAASICTWVRARTRAWVLWHLPKHSPCGRTPQRVLSNWMPAAVTRRRSLRRNPRKAFVSSDFYLYNIFAIKRRSCRYDLPVSG